MNYRTTFLEAKQHSGIATSIAWFPTYNTCRLCIRRMDVEYKSKASAEKIQVHDDARSSPSPPKPIVIEQEYQEDNHEKQVERRLNNDQCITIASGGLQVSK